MDSQNIKEVEKQYPDEWLAFEVHEVDKMNHAVKGKLLAHSPSRKAVYDYLLKHPCEHSYVVFAGQRLPKGMHVVL